MATSGSLSASTSSTHVLSKSTTWLARIFAAFCLLAAVGFPIFDSKNTEMVGVLMYAAAGVLVIAGLLAFARSPWLGVALVSVGAVLGGAGLVWILLPPVAAIVLIVLIVRDARRSASA
jgi:hypothetical protein